MAVITPLGSYSPENFFIVLSSDSFTHEITGFADGSFVNISRVVPHATLYTGSDGSAFRVVRSIRNFDISVTLHQSSESNDVLSQLLLNDESALDNSQLFSITIKDGSGRTHASASQAFIGTTPDAGYASEASEREWVLHAINMDVFFGGNARFSTAGFDSVTDLGYQPDESWNPLNVQ